MMPAISTRDRTSKWFKSDETCFSTVRGLKCNAAAISAFVCPAAIPIATERERSLSE
jgi:hypothetical protein